MALIEPLDLKTILIDKLIGGPESTSLLLFIIFAILVMGILATRFRMPNVVFGGLVMFFVVFMSFTSTFGEGSELKYGLLVLGCIITALAFGRALGKIGG